MLAATWAEGSEYYRSTSQVLDSPAPGPASTALPSERGEPTAAAAVGAVAATGPSGTATASEFAVLRHASQSSDLEGYGGPNSDSSMSGSVAGGLGGKKKKTLFGKISKGFKNLADGFKRKSTGLVGTRNAGLVGEGGGRGEGECNGWGRSDAGTR